MCPTNGAPANLKTGRIDEAYRARFSVYFSKGQCGGAAVNPKAWRVLEGYTPREGAGNANRARGREHLMRTIQTLIQPVRVWVNPDHTVETALLLMRGHRLQGLPVYESGQVLGLVELERLLGRCTRYACARGDDHRTDGRHAADAPARRRRMAATPPPATGARRGRRPNHRHH
jgi:hypothetical protein